MKKPLLYLSLALVFVLSVWAIERPNESAKDDASHDLFLPHFDAAQVTRIEYEHLLGGIELKKEGTQWMVAAFPTKLEKEVKSKDGNGSATLPQEWKQADSERVKRFLGTFGSLEQGILVSHAPKNEMLYRVGVTGQKVRLYTAAGKKIADFVMGKNGPDFFSNYIRRTDEQQVYLVDRSLQGIFSADIKDWVEKPKSDTVPPPTEASTQQPATAKNTPVRHSKSE